MLMYSRLAPLWPLISPPQEYAQEAAFYRDLFLAHGEGEMRSLLELGCGGGNNASYLSRHFEMVLSDLSPQMLAVSQAQNPRCEHVQGDMRSLRLGRQFDGVFIQDAISYMCSEADLRRAMETAYVHCRPGGVAVLMPDAVAQTFRPGTHCDGHDADDGQGLRYLEWTHDPDPGDQRYTVDFAYLVRAADGTVTCLNERHELGLFARQDWLRWLAETGFNASVHPLTVPGVEPGRYEVFVARRPLV